MLVNSKIFRTSTFRLAAIYLIFFVASVLAILGYIYYNTVRLLEHQTEATIKAEVAALADQYRIRGLDGIIDIVSRRSGEAHGGVYLLVDSKRNPLVGNLAELPVIGVEANTWVEFPIHIGKEEQKILHTARAFHIELAGGYELLVGRDIEDLRQFSSLILTSLYSALALALVLGLGGGYFVSRNFLRRIDAITHSSQIVMAGDLAGRMPVTGSDDELDRLSVSLNDMLSQIERLMAGMKEVTSNVAHDLKTPLTRMKARIESALRSDNSQNYQSTLRRTIEDCDDLLSTFNALLSIAQAESGQQRQALEILDAGDVLLDLVELYEPIFEESGGTLTLKKSDDLKVKGNRQLLSQAISNLIDNATKYGQAPIVVQGRLENNQVLISVADKGSGIPPEDRDRVRDRFVRLDQSRSKPGNGLGLSLVSSVMTLHGGKLVLEDNEPGLKVVLLFPMVS